MDAGDCSHSCYSAAYRLLHDARKPSLAGQSRKVSLFFQLLSHLLAILLLWASVIAFTRLDEARKVLQRIRGPFHNIDEEMEAIKSSAEETERELGVNKQFHYQIFERIVFIQLNI